MKAAIKFLLSVGLIWAGLTAVSYAQDNIGPEDLLKLGQEDMARQNFPAAQTYLEQFVSQYPGHSLEAQALTGLIECYFKQRQYHAALATISALLKKYPAQGSAEIYGLLADSLFALKDYSNALVFYRRILLNYPHPTDSTDLHYHLALCSFYLGQNEQVQTYLKALPATGLGTDKNANRQIIMADLAQQDKNPDKAISLWREVWESRIESEELIYTPDELYQKIKQMVEEENNENRLADISRTYRNKFPADIAALKLLQLKQQQFHYPEALNIINNFLTNFPQDPQAEVLTKLRDKLKQAGIVSSGKIGLMVPLTGRYKAFGQAVQRGVELAVEQVNTSQEGTSKVTLLVRDCQGKPERAGELVEQLAQEGVIAIIGPVLSKSAIAAAKEAKRLNIPLFTPTACGHEVIQDTGQTYLFRNCLTNRQQGEAMAKFAVEEMCLKTIAVLHPQNPYGEELAKVFAESVAAFGASIVLNIAYQDKSNDFRPQIEELYRAVPEAVYIPDFGDRVALIAPQILFYAPKEEEPAPTAVKSNGGAKPSGAQPLQPKPVESPLYSTPSPKPDILLLGTHDWLSDKLLQDRGKGFEKAVFPCGFNPDSPDPAVAEFAANFVQRYGQKPDLLAAQAYDAVRILFEALRGNPSRQQLRDNLSRIQSFPGITGITSLTAQGDSTKGLGFIGIRQGKFVELSGTEDWLCQHPAVVEPLPDTPLPPLSGVPPQSGAVQ